MGGGHYGNKWAFSVKIGLVWLWSGLFGCLVSVRAHGEHISWDCLYVSDTIQPVTASTITSDTVTVLDEDAFPAPWSNLHRSLPHCDRGLHSLPGLVPESPAGFLPLLRGAGGGHAHPGAVLGYEQQKCRKLQPPGVRPRVSTLSIQRLPQLRQPCPLHITGEPLPRVPVSVSAQVGEAKISFRFIILSWSQKNKAYMY